MTPTMKRPITVTDILNSVEFELLQQTLIQDDVTEGVHRLRAYQADARNQLRQQSAPPSNNSLVELQINTNEMMLTLIQLLDHQVQALQQELRRAAQLTVHQPGISRSERAVSAETDAAQARDASTSLDTSDDSLSDQSTEEHPPEAFNAFVGDMYLDRELGPIEMDVHESHAPVLGGVLNRVRMSLHELVLFYVNKVVEQQTDVNRAYADALRDLLATVRTQSLELQELRNRLSQLEQQSQSTSRFGHDNAPGH